MGLFTFWLKLREIEPFEVSVDRSEAEEK